VVFVLGLHVLSQTHRYSPENVLAVERRRGEFDHFCIANTNTLHALCFTFFKNVVRVITLIEIFWSNYVKASPLLSFAGNVVLVPYWSLDEQCCGGDATGHILC